MPRIPFAQYAPDVSDNEAETSQNILNVFPQGDGYGPVPGRATVGFGTALASRCRGSFVATNPDGSLVQFAGTSNKLYAMPPGPSGLFQEITRATGGILGTSITAAGTGGTPGTYAGVSVTGGSGSGAVATFVVASGGVTTITITTAGSGYKTSDTGLSASSASIGNTTGFTFSVTALSSASVSNYTALGSSAQWQFCQFNSTVIATQGNDNVQSILLPIGTGSYCADLLGSPPKAGACAVVNRFIVLAQLTANPTRIQWCDLDAITTWTPGTGQADFQDLPDGGNVQNIAGFDLYGVVLQDRRARLLTFVGGDVVFQITSISGGDGSGIYAPYAMASGSNRVFWLSNQGFKMMEPGGDPTPIGKERVDRTFFKSLAASNAIQLQNMLAVTDPSENRVYFTWPISFNSAQFESILVYDWVLDRWSRVNETLEFLCPVMNSSATTGTAKIVLGAFTTSHVLQKYSDSTANLEAQLETPEQGTDNQRIFIRGFRSITDASSVFGSISFRDTTNETTTGSVVTVSITAAGTGGAAGTYTGVALTGGTGTGAKATIAVTAGGVFAIQITSGGTGYAVSDSLSAASGDIGSTTGFTASVTELGPNYTAEAQQNATTGIIPFRKDTRYSRAKIRIPASTTWTFAKGVEPDGDLGGFR